MFCTEKSSGSGKDDLISWQHSKKYFLFLVLVEFKYYCNAVTQKDTWKQVE